MAAPLIDRDTILQVRRSWPLHDQMALAQAILQTVSEQLSEDRPTPQRQSWREMAGLAAVSGKEPPSDEQVAQWLDERRMNKYGG
jgi:hypothetical protein